ncbi:hypothetical protein OFD51_30460, partial [Escherichia coli]|nr:hypothetical protein [Escherichia coli]
MTPAEIAKARAEEAAKEKAEAAAQAQAAALKKARPKRRPQTRAMADVPTPQPGRASPAAQRRAFLIASSAGRVLAAS